MNRPKRQRSCLIYFCREMDRALCCADCWQRDACLDRCLNWPSRCGCVGKSAEEYSEAEQTLVQE